MHRMSNKSFDTYDMISVTVQTITEYILQTYLHVTYSIGGRSGEPFNVMTILTSPALMLLY